jgi:hypothetical protein
MKTGGKLPRFKDGLVEGFDSILKNFMLPWERMRLKNDKMFYKIALHQKTAFSTKYPKLHILHALYLISPFHG